MPQTAKTGNENINIDLASPPGWTYIGGDTVIGNVVRRSHIVTPDAMVTLTLVGRVKTKITVKRNNGQTTSTSHYRGRWQLFHTSRETLFHGPLHLPQGSVNNPLIWPFSVEIPTRPSYQVLQGHCPEESYLPLDKETLARSTLPASFFSSGRGWRTSSEAFVEYYLEAQLIYGRSGSFETEIATFPITIRHAPQAGIFNYDLQSRVLAGRAKSQRLLPGMEHAELSLKQKTQKLFGSSKVPEFHYTVEVSWPYAIQLDHPAPVPIIIGVKPSSASPEIRDVGQKVQLNWVNMTIKSETMVRAPGNLTPTYTHNHTHSSSHPIGLKQAFLKLENPIVFTTGKGNEPVDIGSMFGLLFHSNGSTVGGLRNTTYTGPSPDFVTYNILHRNGLELAVSLTVAEETKEFKMSSGLKIFAAE
ncbi:hypothetical protein ANOM_011404 [Aspergillus nomiae NRRL 13137]|uniref:Arrestin-like N-terminal domain-containing protein n=1 Tax=Aspergillus nomiae NRRL (strain ATCC 15546 / NRRL 13137 / CBS 260.88 / M93) TaxID=1509407 RepID=A0A0L1ILY8_ASPN3|nr:uncharacterized protein ANOM_011404 [Aspergillus nomiae NRRL 13137]KNG80188.1 hypothetical protein ANOM_011404 [Aspergillus nomiae NRRL 13137]